MRLESAASELDETLLAGLVQGLEDAAEEDDGRSSRRVELLSRLESAAETMDDAYLEGVVYGLEKDAGEGRSLLRAALLTRLESAASHLSDGHLNSLARELEKCGGSGEAGAEQPGANDEASTDTEGGTVPAELVAVAISTVDPCEQLADMTLAVRPEDVPSLLRDVRAVAGRCAQRYADALRGDAQDADTEAV